ncbi:hypothetical protein HAX54_041555 [Datura stramonium]|uniref:Uncharacterized protein n=1 Tax=Datura stramonium TaxID=4076 RepID=A0ABS8RNM9_DATST|nr:hypothetical protein [Datura stramonium]
MGSQIRLGLGSWSQSEIGFPVRFWVASQVGVESLVLDRSQDSYPESKLSFGSGSGLSLRSRIGLESWIPAWCWELGVELGS